MKSTCVFLGPTLSKEKAANHLDAIYLPPVKHGDVYLSLDNYAPEVIVIIDGYFEQVPSVWHKEILWALSLGIEVWGASSIGALRAAELKQFGMMGSGRIYEAYVNGVFVPFEYERFEDDDEVAVVHGPEAIGYPSSTAMVDIRATLAAAEECSVINAETRNILAQAAKSVFYKNRNYTAMLQQGLELGIHPDEISEFAIWVRTNKVDQKRLDAEELLIRLSKGTEGVSTPKFRFEFTSTWESALKALGENSQERTD